MNVQTRSSRIGMAMPIFGGRDSPESMTMTSVFRNEHIGQFTESMSMTIRQRSQPFHTMSKLHGISVSAPSSSHSLINLSIKDDPRMIGCMSM